jgi:hypothetical protein
MGRIFGGRGRPPRRPTADASGEDEVGHAQADGAALEAVDHGLMVVVEGDLHRGGAIVPYVGSAVGLEMVWVALGHGPDDGAYDWVTLGQVTLEEGGEMVGVALFIHALVDYLRAAGARLELTF